MKKSIITCLLIGCFALVLLISGCTTVIANSGLTATKTPIPIATSLPTATSIPSNLVWKPYLQQVTDHSVIILWSTQSGANPEVKYSTDSSYGSSASGTSRTLSVLGTQLHTVALGGLLPNSLYHYKIFVDNLDLLPEETLSFQTAPPVGSSTPFTFIDFSDYGYGSTTQKQLRDQMTKDSFQFILTNGDNAQIVGAYHEYDAFVFKIYGDIFDRAAVFPTVGNHDYDTDHAAPYLDLFDLPDNAGVASADERYYSFDYGNAHFISLDTIQYCDFKQKALDMYAWLRNDLSQTTQTWKIVDFHYPAYSIGNHGSTACVQKYIVPILEQYGVNLVFSGHDSIYMRTKPLRGGQVTTTGAGGIVYIVDGGGDKVSAKCTSADWVDRSYCSLNYGVYNRITINGDNLLVEAIDAYGKLIDIYSISKSFSAPSPASISSGPNQPFTKDTSATLTFSAAGLPNLDHIECSLDSSSFTPCTSPMAYTNLTESSHTFTIHTVDKAGNINNVISYPWTVDFTGPIAKISTGPEPLSNSTSATFTFSASDNLSGVMSFKCYLDSAAGIPCTSPMTLTDITEGKHKFYIRATDNAGNTSPYISYAWTVALIKPTTLP